ncbi:FxLYD domain-containing protein [Streptomyces microflavus]|uniref:FxLYD domain-containing protein n=1 Tax=Streptomyces microflavus TaxID=1919 RepID=UPI0036B89A37
MSQQYPQGQQPQWGQQPGWGGQPPAPKKSSAGKIVGFSCLGVVALVVVLGVVGVALGGSDSGSDTGSDGVLEVTAAPSEKAAAPEAKAPAGAEGDVKITGCEVSDATGWPKADVLITNRSSKTSNYIVSVEFVDGTGKRLGEAFAASNNVAAGQEVEEDAQSLDKVEGKVSCRVTKVTRYAS